jgi:hypothetical protein
MPLQKYKSLTVNRITEKALNPQIAENKADPKIFCNV